MKSHRPAGSIAPVKCWLDYGVDIGDVTQWSDLTGGERLAAAPTIPRWAYFRSLSGSEIYAAYQQIALEEVLFVVNWQSGITPAMRVIFKGDMYEIVRVDTFEGYKGDVRLYCKRVTAG